MSNRNDGGPAFPKPLDPYPNAQGMESGSLGMSLRDWFAGQFLAGFFANPELPRFIRESALEGEKFGQTASRLAYDYADAMLKAREAGR